MSARRDRRSYNPPYRFPEPRHIASMFRGFAGSARSAGPGDRYNAELRPAVRARDTWAMFRYDASQALPKIQYPPSCFTGNLDSLNIHETAASAGAPNLFGWNPRGIYPSTNADTKCRHALRCFPTSCNNQSGWKNVAGSAP